VVLQSDALNRSQLATTVCVVLTSQLRWQLAPGNVLLPAKTTGLDRDSVANVSQLITVDKSQLKDCVGRVSSRHLEAIFAGVDLILGR